MAGYFSQSYFTEVTASHARREGAFGAVVGVLRGNKCGGAIGDGLIARDDVGAVG